MNAWTCFVWTINLLKYIWLIWKMHEWNMNNWKKILIITQIIQINIPIVFFVISCSSNDGSQANNQNVYTRAINTNPRIIQRENDIHYGWIGFHGQGKLVVLTLVRKVVFAAQTKTKSHVYEKKKIIWPSIQFCCLLHLRF